MRLRKWKPDLANGRPRSKLQYKHDLPIQRIKDLPMENYLTETVTINYIVRKLNLKIKFKKFVKKICTMKLFI